MKPTLFAALVLVASACAMAADDSDPAVAENAEALTFPTKGYLDRAISLGFTLIAQPGGPTCPAGSTQSSLSFSTCLDPVLYNCTAYYCSDGQGHAQLATPQPGHTNPVCVKAPLQTDACSSNPTTAEKFVPGPRDLYDLAPQIFPKQLLDIFK